MSEFESIDFESDPPRGRKRNREGDICDFEGQHRHQFWEEEAATQTAMTGRMRRGGRGRGVERSSSQHSQTPFDNLPELHSRATTRSRSRSQSPVRQTILGMTAARPPVRLELESALVMSRPPMNVETLIKTLTLDSERAIPASMRSHFEKDYPNLTLPESVFMSDEQLYDWGVDVETGWKRVQEISRRAAKCLRNQMDENAWCHVVRLVLELALEIASDLDDEFALEINNIQSQALKTAFLPRTSQLRIIDRKIDFAIAIDMEKGSHFAVQPEQISSSPMTDAYTERLPLLCGLEVKRHGGDQVEAQLQLMVWQAAMLTHLDHLRQLGGNANLPLPPVVGWIVIGHVWQFYIAWKEPGGDVIIQSFSSYEPASSASTNNTGKIFVLLKILVKLVRWFKTQYYPAYDALLQQAVESLTVNVDPSDA